MIGHQAASRSMVFGTIIATDGDRIERDERRIVAADGQFLQSPSTSVNTWFKRLDRRRQVGLEGAEHRLLRRQRVDDGDLLDQRRPGHGEEVDAVIDRRDRR
jgi:hypothetical protein